VKDNTPSFLHTEAHEYRDRSMRVDDCKTYRRTLHTKRQISIKKKHRRMA